MTEKELERLTRVSKRQLPFLQTEQEAGVRRTMVAWEDGRVQPWKQACLTVGNLL